MNTLAFVGGLNTWELLIILVIALLLFGKRLPEVGKSLGKGIIEFKKGLKGVEEEIEETSSRPAPRNESSQVYRSELPQSTEGRVSRAESAEVPSEGKPASNS